MVSFPAVLVKTPGVPSRPFTPRSQVQGGMGAAKQEWGWVKTYELTIFWGITIPSYQLFKGEIIYHIFGKKHPFTFTDHFKGFSVWVPGSWPISKYDKDRFVMMKFCLVAIFTNIFQADLSNRSWFPYFYQHALHTMYYNVLYIYLNIIYTRLYTCTPYIHTDKDRSLLFLVASLFWWQHLHMCCFSTYQVRSTTKELEKLLGVSRLDFTSCSYWAKNITKPKILADDKAALAAGCSAVAMLRYLRWIPGKIINIVKMGDML